MSADFSKFLRKSQEVIELMLNHDITASDKTLKTLQASAKTAREKRICLHLEGNHKTMLNELHSARQCYEKALSLGENVALLRDLAACYYHLDEQREWKRSYRLLYANLHEYRQSIDPRIRVECSLMLAKFFEEEGAIHHALKLFDHCLEDDESIKDSALRQASLAQIIRLKAMFGREDSLGECYRRLISADPDSFSCELQYEIEHALMLAEMRLVGPDHAWARVERLLKGKLSDFDRNIMLYDYLDELLVQGLKPSPELTEIFANIRPSDPFERELHRIAFESSKTSKFSLISPHAAQMSFASYLRLLTVVLNQCPEAKLKEEIKNKIHLVLGALEVEARPYWMKRLQSSAENEGLVINYARAARALSFQNKQLSLARRKGMLQLIELLTDQKQVDVEDVIRQIWKADFSPDYYNRLRMTVHRLNEMLFDLTSEPKLLEVNSERVSLKPTVNITGH